VLTCALAGDLSRDIRLIELTIAVIINRVTAHILSNRERGGAGVKGLALYTAQLSHRGAHTYPTAGELRGDVFIHAPVTIFIHPIAHLI
jgi:hypothetical protein